MGSEMRDNHPTRYIWCIPNGRGCLPTVCGIWYAYKLFSSWLHSIAIWADLSNKSPRLILGEHCEQIGVPTCSGTSPTWWSLTTTIVEQPHRWVRRTIARTKRIILFEISRANKVLEQVGSVESSRAIAALCVKTCHAVWAKKKKAVTWDVSYIDAELLDQNLRIGYMMCVLYPQLQISVWNIYLFHVNSWPTSRFCNTLSSPKTHIFAVSSLMLPGAGRTWKMQMVWSL